jgi:UDP-N-acetylmuramoyl-L-alanyl-D-glutamate--2,6-diaminopimelate ligase
MGEIASSLADFVILSSDNPRTENPETILDQVAAGFPRGFQQVLRQPDRRAAIRAALSMGRAGDVILLAGKGHETYQEIGTERIHLDEREEITSFFLENRV